MTVALALPLIGVKGLLVPEKLLTVVEIKLPLPTGTSNQFVPSVVARIRQQRLERKPRA
jgi:hypothetical protein